MQRLTMGQCAENKQLSVFSLKWAIFTNYPIYQGSGNILGEEVEEMEGPRMEKNTVACFLLILIWLMQSHTVAVVICTR